MFLKLFELHNGGKVKIIHAGELDKGFQLMEKAIDKATALQRKKAREGKKALMNPCYK